MLNITIATKMNKIVENTVSPIHTQLQQENTRHLQMANNSSPAISEQEARNGKCITKMGIRLVQHENNENDTNENTSMRRKSTYLAITSHSPTPGSMGGG